MPYYGDYSEDGEYLGEFSDDELEKFKQQIADQFQGLDYGEEFLSRFDTAPGIGMDGMTLEPVNFAYDADSLVNYLEGTPVGVLRVIQMWDDDAEAWFWEIYRYDS